MTDRINATPPSRFSLHKDQVVTALIRRTAHQMRRLPVFRGLDLDDLVQELTLKLIQAMEQFDPDRGHPRSFLATVLTRHFLTLIRDYSTEKRDDRNCQSLQDYIHDDGSRPIAGTEFQELADGEVDLEQERADLALDLDEVLQQLPDHLRDLAERLKTSSISGAARDLGIPRSRIAREIEELRTRFEDAGLRAYL